MTDFLLELLSEEIPARMQDGARADLARLFAVELSKSGLAAAEIETFATPRRLALIARELPEATEATAEELKGPRANAPPQALDGFLRKTGLTRDALTERDGVLFAVIEKPGCATTQVLAEAIPLVVRAFPWPKSMRWGAASISTESPRWVRPLQGIVALFGDAIVDCEVAGISSGAATVGHRFHHPGPITIGGAHDYVEKLRACHVIVDQDERKTIIRDAAAALAANAGLLLVEDEGLVGENAGLTEWPVPLLGSFDPAFLEVPPEVIRLTMRTNQKYFALSPLPLAGGVGGGGVDTAPPSDTPSPSASPKREGNLAPHFICTANLAATDGGAKIAEGNAKVLAARLADARFFWEQDRKRTLAEHAEKLKDIVFHEKLGTVADKVERVAKLATWLVDADIVRSGESTPQAKVALANAVADAARLCKADLVTAMVGEFPELQGVMGGHYALAEGLDPRIAAAIRDHYKPVGQGDDVPTDPVTVAVSLADKLDSLVGFFAADMPPTGSKDPFALRRAALGVLELITSSALRLSLRRGITVAAEPVLAARSGVALAEQIGRDIEGGKLTSSNVANEVRTRIADATSTENFHSIARRSHWVSEQLLNFFADRLKVQQREAGVRHDLIDAVFALGGEDDLVRLLARVHALQAFVATEDGANLLAGYKRAANILKKSSPEGGSYSHPFDDPNGIPQTGEEDPLSLVEELPDLTAPVTNPLSYTPEKAESDLIAALDSAEPTAARAVEAEDFEAAMTALATLRVPIDRFFDEVTVNDPDPTKRETRLALLARVRDAVHRVADFSRIEG